MSIEDLNNELGNIDIYLLDQILKGRYQQTDKILDAGCGEGRNLVWFLRNNYNVFGVDKNSSAIKMLQFVARTINPALPKDNFLISNLEHTSFPDLSFEAIISSAVLHFAENEMHFYQLFDEMIRLLKFEGNLFIRMASNIGAEDKIEAHKDMQTLLPDGSTRFLLSRNILDNLIKKYPILPVEPIKTVNVQDERFMSTLVFQKKSRKA
jgi:SAM-dependent methyltransferase